jgi:type IV secretion system protein VirD4
MSGLDWGTARDMVPPRNLAAAYYFLAPGAVLYALLHLFVLNDAAGWALSLVVTPAAGVHGVFEGKRGGRYAGGSILAGVVLAIFTPVQSVAYWAGWSWFRHGYTLRGLFGHSPAAAWAPPSAQAYAPAYAPPPGAPVAYAPPPTSAPTPPRAGAFFGLNGDTVVKADPRGAALVIGPPKSGKSTGVVFPSVATAPGAVVSTSTKWEVLVNTVNVRRRMGRVWYFDPSGESAGIDGVEQVRWSPLVGVKSWDDARAYAHRMVTPYLAGASDSHWMEKARDWLETFLYAAKLDGLTMADVARWVGQPAAPETADAVRAAFILAAHDGDEDATVASEQNLAMLAIDERERSGIASSMQRVLKVYASAAARKLTEAPNFDPHAFVRSRDTLYIAVPEQRTQLYAPVIVALLDAIKQAQYDLFASFDKQGRKPAAPMTFVLDECANTAKLNIPQIVSEAGGQSLHLVCAFQDLSQARNLWGKAADGLLTLFPDKLVLRGVNDMPTLQAISTLAGDRDRQVYSHSPGHLRPGAGVGDWMNGTHRTPDSFTYSMQRVRVLDPADVANIPAGRALHIEGAQVRAIYTLPWYSPAWSVLKRGVAQ